MSGWTAHAAETDGVARESDLSADPLDDVLRLLGVRGTLSPPLVAGGRWAVAFPPPAGAKFVGVRRGTALLQVEGEPEPVVLSAGDCCLLTRPVPFRLGSDLTRDPEPAHPLYVAAATEGVARAGTGSDVLTLGGSFDFGDRARDLLLDGLPPVVRVPAGTAEAGALDWSLQQLEREARHPGVGSRLVVEHLVLVMLVQVLRAHLATAGAAAPGLLAALADPVVAAALRAMHERPAHAWTVAELAATAAVSRSTMAARFRRALGHGPLEHLTRWRIELAAEAVRDGRDTLAVIARTVGYGSESALSNAFKRVTGTSPRQYRHRA
ncbi:AraC family transcriptional regulator [Modestobacter sp. VKM Ac-2986]|uniref:AraC family transcriptional regulator n=1 Tax=Modestobacter sp. VKM Ac-2986 TaxID=3004140 RepID=UPI0022AB67CF|nr:AraC family transcriptional regulator [Modestobacter sp. VKM Ac-2986]MCZ2830403.1 AraC family transcriptional regulator [Modestobacter sp. VKM Ac-2986]